MYIKLGVQTFQPLIVIYLRVNLVNHYWGCTSIYRPLSYPWLNNHYVLTLQVMIKFFINKNDNLVSSGAYKYNLTFVDLRPLGTFIVKS